MPYHTTHIHTQAAMTQPNPTQHTRAVIHLVPHLHCVLNDSECVVDCCCLLVHRLVQLCEPLDQQLQGIRLNQRVNKAAGHSLIVLLLILEHMFLGGRRGIRGGGGEEAHTSTRRTHRRKQEQTSRHRRRATAIVWDGSGEKGRGSA